MNDLNFNDFDDLDESDDTNEEIFEIVEEAMQTLANEDQSINDIAFGELDKTALRMFIASNIISISEATVSMIEYIKDDKDVRAILSNLVAQTAFGQNGIVRVLMGLHKQQDQMLKYMNESNTYLAVIMKRIEDYDKSTNTDRELGSKKQDEESTD